jgi:hypothetical protein
MATPRVWTAAEMELMSPDERSRIVQEGQLSSLDELDPEFRDRVEKKSRRIAEEYGILNAEST